MIKIVKKKIKFSSKCSKSKIVAYFGKIVHNTTLANLLYFISPSTGKNKRFLTLIYVFLAFNKLICQRRKFGGIHDPLGPFSKYSMRKWQKGKIVIFFLFVTFTTFPSSHNYMFLNMINLDRLFTKSVLFTKGLKIQDSYQSWPLNAATIINN